MKEYLLWRKIARIVHIIACRLGVSDEKALGLYYSTKVSRWMSSRDYGMQEMPDDYVADEACMELQSQNKVGSKALG